MSINNDLIQAVSAFIHAAFESAQTKAKTKRIRDNLKMTDAHSTGQNSVGASIEISLLVAPEAAAYEFGSGTHDPLGSHLIPIRAIAPKKALSFWWANENKQFIGPKLPLGHPGVAAQPALGPAMQESRPILIHNIDAFVRQEISSIIVENNARMTT